MSQLTLNIGKLKSDLQLLVTREVLPEIIRLAKPAIQERIADHYAEAFNSTELSVGFDTTDGSERDVGAILGLRPDEITTFKTTLISAIREATKVVQLTSLGAGGFTKTGLGEGIIFSIRTPDLPKILLNQNVGTYFSDRNNIEVPWLKWLLHGSDTLDHGVYFIKPGRKTEESRSGRAFMIENIQLFNIDDYNRFTNAFEQGDNERNFLSEMAQNPEFRKDSNQIILEELGRATGRLNMTI